MRSFNNLDKVTEYKVTKHRQSFASCRKCDIKRQKRRGSYKRSNSLTFFFFFIRITDCSVRESCPERRSADLQMMRWLHLDLRNTSQQNNLCTTSVRLLLWRFQSYYLLRDTIESCRSAARHRDCLANRCFPRSTAVKEEPTNTTGRKKQTTTTTIAESHCRKTAAETHE